MSPSNGSILLQAFFFMVNQSQEPTEYSNNYYYLNIGKEINATKCYGNYGCFNLAPPWTSEHRPVSLFPESSSRIEPRFMYLTRENTNLPHPHFDLNDHYDVIKSANINPELPVYLISHGFMESGDKPWIREMGLEFLKREDCTVILIDWGRGSAPPYTQAVANIRLVGAITANLLADLAEHTGYKKLDHVHCIGHSLGAHLCGYAGYVLQDEFGLTLGRITGMDPAEPHFAKAKPPVRLDRSAAKYVDIVHTDASAFIRGGLGMIESIGHVDYYPNGGTDQPGCGKSFVEYVTLEKGSFVKGIRQYLGCNHLRSHEYFAASINPKCSFKSIACPSFDSFKNGECFECGRNGKHCVTFGYHGRRDYENLLKNGLIKPNESLVLYLLTGNQRPYCKAHYHASVKISNTEESRLHGGEIGQLLLKMHSSTDGKGIASDKVSLNEGGYHEPGAVYSAVIAADEVPSLKAIEIEWNYQSSVFNPLTWRLLSSPRIFITKVTVQELETKQSITACSKNKEPLISGIQQMFLPAYCTN